MLPLALSLLSATTDYKLLETFPSNGDKIIGSPVAQSFYLERRSLSDPTAKKNGPHIVELFEKVPGQSPRLNQTITGEPHLLGTDNKGQPVYQLKPLPPGPNGKIPNFTIDSGTKIETHEDGSLTIVGPPRRSPVDYLSGNMGTYPSVVIIPQHLYKVSSDGRNHLVTLDVYRNSDIQPYSLNLIKWGETINTLQPQKSFQFLKNSKEGMTTITALAAAKEQFCYIVRETWHTTANGFNNQAEREIVAVDIAAQTMTVITSNLIPGPTRTASGEIITEPVEICTIQNGKYLAVTQSGNIAIFQRL